MGLRRMRIRYVGDVQGVGFRWTSRMIADELGITGWVRNEPDGSVLAELQGTDEQLSNFYGTLLNRYRPVRYRFSIDASDDIPLVAGEDDFSVRF